MHLARFLEALPNRLALLVVPLVALALPGEAWGHATLLRASDAVRNAVDVFHPQPSGLAALNERVRVSFDPKVILNRGRMLLMTAT